MSSISTTHSSEPLLKLSGASLGYEYSTLLDRVSFQVAESDILGVIGDNAVGKTTLFRGLFAEGAWLKGELFWCGRRVPHLRDGILSCEISYVRQDRPIFFGLRVEDAVNVVSALKGRRLRNRRLSRLLQLLPELRPLLRQRMEHLSGGERALVSVGIGLVNEPKLVCMDEPAANLSGAMQARLREVIRSFVRGTGGSCVIIEHRVELLQGLAKAITRLRPPVRT